MSAKKGARILGPYPERGGTQFRVIETDAAGNRSPVIFANKDKAERYIELFKAELLKSEDTTATALEEYKRHLLTKATSRSRFARSNSRSRCCCVASRSRCRC